MSKLVNQAELVESLSNLDCSTAAGASWANESAKALSKAGSLKNVKFIVESALASKDESLSEWATEQNKIVSNIAFETALVLESLSVDRPFGFTTELAETLKSTLAIEDYDSMVGEIAVGSVLDQWRVLKPIAGLVQKAKESYAKDSTATATQGGHPIGAIITDKETNENFVTFDGVNYKVVDNKLAIAQSYPSELGLLQKALLKCGSFANSVVDGFLFDNCGIGTVVVSDEGLSLDGRAITLENFKSIALDYYNLNKMSLRGRDITKKLDLLLSCLPTVLTYWGSISILSNVTIVKDDSLYRCYFSENDDSTYSNIKVFKAELGVMSRVSIENFDQLGQAINALPYSFAKNELADKYSAQITSEIANDKEKKAIITDKKLEIGKVDNTIGYAKSSLEGLAGNFIDSELKKTLEAKLVLLEEKKVKLQGELALLA